MKGQMSFQMIMLILAVIFLLFFLNPIKMISEISDKGREGVGVKSADRYFTEGWEFYEKGEYGDASTKFGKVLDIKGSENRSQARFNQLLCRFAMKDFRNAENELKKLRDEELTREQQKVVERIESDLDTLSSQKEKWMCCDFADFGDHWSYRICLDEHSSQGPCPHKPRAAYAGTGQSDGGSSQGTGSGQSQDEDKYEEPDYTVLTTENGKKEMTLEKDGEEITVVRVDEDHPVVYFEEKDGTLNREVMFVQDSQQIWTYKALWSTKEVSERLDSDDEMYEEERTTDLHLPEEEKDFSVYENNGDWLVFYNEELFEINRITRYYSQDSECYTFVKNAGWGSDKRFTMC